MSYEILPTNKIKTYLIELPNKSANILFEFRFASGYLYAPKGKQELSHLLEHYLCNQLTENKIENSGSTYIDNIYFNVSFPKKTFPKKFRKFLEILLSNPINDSKIFQTEQSILLNELAGILDDLSKFSYRITLNKRLSNHTPYLTTLKDYNKISFADLKDFYQKSCFPEKVSLFIGAHKPSQALKNELTQIINDRVDILSSRGDIDIKNAEVVYNPKPLLIRKNLATNRLNVKLIWSGPTSFSDPKEQVAIDILSTILYEQESSLIWEKARKEAGILYDLDGDREFNHTYGQFEIYADVLPKECNKFLAIVFSQIERVKNKDYPISLLKKAIRENIKNCRKNFTGNENRFNWTITDIASRKKVYSLEDWIGYNKEIDQPYLAEIAQKYFTKKSLSITLVGGRAEKFEIDSTIL